MTIGHHTTGTERAGGSYVDANGVHTYYEVEGTGDPLILLHGGLCAIETLAGLGAGLAERYQVYRPERRGHGRTPDVEGPFSYGQFADDTIAFVEALGLESVHVVGFSDGATVGLLMALRRPDLVRSLVHIGQQANPSGMPAEFQEVMKLDAFPQGMLPPMLQISNDDGSAPRRARRASETRSAPARRKKFSRRRVRGPLPTFCVRVRRRPAPTARAPRAPRRLRE